MVFGCQSPSENHFVHFSAIKSGNCSWAIISPLQFSLREDGCMTSPPVPSTKSLRAQCKERNNLETCSILTAIFLLQAKSPIRSIDPKWQSLQKSPLEMWNKSSAAGVKGGAVNWASDTEQEAVLPFSALLEPYAGHLHPCIQEIAFDLFQHLFPLCFGIENITEVMSETHAYFNLIIWMKVLIW